MLPILTSLQSFCLTFLLLCLPSLLYAGSSPDAWVPAPCDLKQALPNKADAPQRLRPLTLLPPLPDDQLGTVRSVELTKQEPLLALTFDLCELATSTTGCDTALLQFLRAEKIPATLFMGGKWMRTHKARVKQILKEPLFEIANHNWSHGNCALLPPKDLEDQILWTQSQYELIREEVENEARAGKTTLPPMASVPRLFRLPYGRCTEASLQKIAQLGLTTIQWNVVGELGAVRSPAQAKRYAQSLARQVTPGSILLFHANLVPVGSYELVRELIPRLQAKGYRFVTVSELLQHGKPVFSQDGYFSHPGDNLALDKRFGRYGTGPRR